MKLYQVDAFTNEMYRGNPAGVCVLPEDSRFDDRLLQDLAMEMNLSETAFLKKKEGGYDLRWFTPVAEIDFCGHATLASAHILWETGTEDAGAELRFGTRSGTLTATRKGALIEMNFPLREVNETGPDGRIEEALSVRPLFIGTDSKRYVIEVRNREELRGLAPDFGKLAKIGNTAFTLTCESGGAGYDFFVRFFAPAFGIDEDPVTGSAQSYLAPYWSGKLGKKCLRSHQDSKRGGELECEIADGRVLVRGEAVTVFDIELREGAPLSREGK